MDKIDELLKKLEEKGVKASKLAKTETNEEKKKFISKVLYEINIEMITLMHLKNGTNLMTDLFTVTDDNIEISPDFKKLYEDQANKEKK